MESTPIIQTNDVMKPNLTNKSWDEFRATGLYMFINSILHAFGWVIVCEVDKETKQITKAYPARTRFRGFAVEDQEEMHQKIGSYLKDTSEELFEESR